jgi:hypothetical protein
MSELMQVAIELAALLAAVCAGWYVAGWLLMLRARRRN